MEPPDVRKSRQLTLDNMKLHRELEKMKQGMCKKNRYVCTITYEHFLHDVEKLEVRPQSFTSLKPDVCQDINTRGFAFSRCLNGTFPLRKRSV